MAIKLLIIDHNLKQGKITSMKIAVDGASATGKSTVCGQLSQRLNILHLDTGAMYRVVALKAQKENIELNEVSVDKLIKDINMDIQFIDGKQREFLDGKCVTNDIRQHAISAIASDISAFESVRAKMLELQRKIATRQPSILDGRDIGTYVLPDADIKFFLTAELECRTNRRYKELKEKGQDVVYEKIKADIERRDFNDSNRKIAPLKKADDAIEIDSTSLSVEEVIEKMLAYIEAFRAKTGK